MNLAEYKTYLKSSEAKFYYTNKVKNKRKYFFEKFGKKFFLRYFRWRYFFTKKPSLFHIEYKVTTICTLKCKECCHYTPYFENNIKQVPFEKFKIELDKLLKSVDLLYALDLIGGETLLSQDLPKMVKYAQSKHQIKHVNITTNATLLPSDELIKVLKNNKKTIVWISNHSANESLKPKLKIKELVEIFDKNNILYSVSDFENETMPPWEKPPLVLSPGEAKNNFTKTKDCRIHNCHTYANGILYLCPLQFYMLFGKHGYKAKNDETVNIMKANPKDVTKSLLAFYNKENFDFCHYCKLPSPEMFIETAEQLEEVK